MTEHVKDETYSQRMTTLEWRSRIRTDSVGGWTQVDSGGFRAAAVDSFAVFHRLHGHVDLESDVEDETSVNARRFE
jgi:hypothetical protein